MIMKMNKWTMVAPESRGYQKVPRLDDFYHDIEVQVGIGGAMKSEKQGKMAKYLVFRQRWWQIRTVLSETRR